MPILFVIASRSSAIRDCSLRIFNLHFSALLRCGIESTGVLLPAAPLVLHVQN